MTAVMKSGDVDVYSRYMVVFSAVFLCASLLLTKLLASFGFIFANCINMVLRIVYSVKVCLAIRRMMLINTVKDRSTIRQSGESKHRLHHTIL
jgi:hypothetical protein